MIKQLIFTLLLVAVVSAKVVKEFKDCGSKDGKIVSIEIEPCEKEPCPLTRGSNSTIKYTFSPKLNVTSLKNLVYGYIAGVPVPWPLPNPEACSGCGLTCPLTAGETYTYSNVIDISASYPSLNLVIKWEAKDQSGGIVVCWTVPVSLE